MRIVLLILFSFIAFSFSVEAQNTNIHNAAINDGDTTIKMSLPAYYVVDYPSTMTKKQRRRHTRLVRYVKKVYPYAKLAGKKLQEYDSLLRNAKSEKEKRKLMKQAEKEIRAEYEGKLRKFTITQGKILVKLIDRETNHTSYELLKELRGSVNAVLWQGVGRIFGYNLKVRYDPLGKDKKIEEIVQLIEMGAI